MGSFGAPSAKPSKGWTNNKQFGLVDQGPYHHDPSKEKLKTVKKTISKSGKVSVSGTTDLKKTQLPGLQFDEVFVSYKPENSFWECIVV